MKRTVTTLVLTVIAVAALAPAAGAGGGGHGAFESCAGFGSGDELVMRDNCFEGIGHAVGQVGATLTVVNEGQLAHQLTAVDGSFDTGTVAPGRSAEVALESAGIFEVYCPLHASTDGGGMAGLLVVGDPAAAGPAGASSVDDVGSASGDAAAARSEVVTGAWAWWLLAVAVGIAVAVMGGSLAIRGRRETTA